MSDVSTTVAAARHSALRVGLLRLWAAATPGRMAERVPDEVLRLRHYAERADELGVAGPEGARLGAAFAAYLIGFGVELEVAGPSSDVLAAGALGPPERLWREIGRTLRGA
jgi:hypothetical protein